MKRGSITVFLSLLLAACITLVMVLTEHVRTYGLKQRFEQAAGSAMDSLFSMYDRDVLEEFDILLLNVNSLADGKSTETALEEYLSKNLNSQLGLVTGYGSLYRGSRISAEEQELISVTENEGELFARSVLDYMKYRIPGITAETVQRQLSDLEKGDDVMEKAAQKEGEVKKKSDEAFEKMSKEDQKKYDEAVRESWFEKLKKMQDDGWLEYVLPIDKVASAYRVDTSYLPSSWMTPGLTWTSSGIGEAEERFLFTEYLLEHCSCFTTNESSEGMQYELEYVLNGSASDKENLKKTIIKLLAVRTGLNLFSALKEPALSQQADAATAALAGWTGIPAIAKAIKFAILTGWSFAESVIDLRTLLAGGCVPIIKSAGNWSLSLEDMGKFLDKDLMMTGDGQEGLDYSEYMRLLLYTQGRQYARFRTMDVIQLRMDAKKTGFYIGDCAGALQVSVEMEAKPLFFRFVAQDYRLSVTLSRMY